VRLASAVQRLRNRPRTESSRAQLGDPLASLPLAERLRRQSRELPDHGHLAAELRDLGRERIQVAGDGLASEVRERLTSARIHRRRA
jgi:hypothetical protein